jgi:hypothetical protein
MDLIVGLCTILGNLALVCSLLLLFRELRASNRLTRAANAQSLVGLAAPLYLELVQDRQLAELCTRSAADFDSLDEIDQRRYRYLLTWWLIFYENIFYQRRQHFLDAHAFMPWWRDLKNFVREQNLIRHWDELKDFFQAEFAQALSDLVADLKPRKDSDSAAGRSELVRKS